MNPSPANIRHRFGSPLKRLLLLLLLGAVGAEIALRLLTSPTTFLFPYDAAYWKTQLRQQLAARGADRLLPDDLIHDPALGWRMKPDFHADGIHHDADGHRRTPTHPTDAAFEIVLLGDSFTYGLGVGDDETFGAHLAEATGATVVNAAVTAHGIDQSLLVWEEQARQRQPRFVVLGYAVDKFFTNPLPVRNLPKPWFSVEDTSLRLQGVPVPPPERLETSGRLAHPFSPRLIEAIRWLHRKIGAKLGWGDDFEPQAQLSDALLGSLNDAVTANGGTLITMFIGHCFDGERDNLVAERAIMASCERRGLRCINMAEAMRGDQFQDYYGDNCHWSARGHHFAAAKLLEVMRGDD